MIKIPLAWVNKIKPTGGFPLSNKLIPVRLIMLDGDGE